MITPFHRRLFLPSRAAQSPRAADHTVAREIRSLSQQLAGLPDRELPTRTDELRRQVFHGKSLAARDITVPSFALTLEAARRALGMLYYDVQLLAGLALARGAVAEMKTGEGKTIVAALPACLHALTARGVHVATVNQYLARRDFEQMSAIYTLLGFTVGLAAEQDSPSNKRRAYACDVTYATGYELGFDFLRDQTMLRSQQQLPLGEAFRRGLRGESAREALVTQRGHALVIIDEADSVLIDEANTPLLLSGAGKEDRQSSACYRVAADVADTLIIDSHYTLDPRTNAVHLTDLGLTEVFENHSTPDCGMVRPWTQYIEQTLRARQLQNNIDYVVRDAKVMIVDKSTGRIFTERTWRDGLHQSVEQKEGVKISPEQRGMARVSRQRFFRMYQTICGMTGTAQGLESELRQIYGLHVVLIPQRLPNRRLHERSRYFRDRLTKWKAITEDIAQRNLTGQPILVGTRTIQESITLSQMLDCRGIEHQVLNGVQTEEEADLISSAGQMWRVTIATNMAGRGTDIRLDAKALAAGGLHVIATEHQESRRVDRQLIGRAARQGQIGSCQFFVSGEDDLLVRYGELVAQRITESCNQHGTTPQADWTREINAAQRLAEREAYQRRRELFQRDSWLNEVLATVAQRNRSVDQRYPAVR